MSVLIFLMGSTVNSFRVQFDFYISDVHNIFFGLSLWLRADAVLIFDAAISFNIDENFILFSFTLFDHVALKVGECELKSIFEETGGWFKDGGCFMKVALAFLKIKFDIAVDPIVSEVS